MIYKNIFIKKQINVDYYPVITEIKMEK
ncbi:SAM-dependent methyltransferase [Yersinia pestis]|nr:SAM-dependent methyltransferase [Yersinia pestis subsp. microtus bv. Caucasica]PVF56832.1 SAM-dependent methyltransferase [Yersinia pestis]